MIGFRAHLPAWLLLTAIIAGHAIVGCERRVVSRTGWAGVADWENDPNAAQRSSDNRDPDGGGDGEVEINAATGNVWAIAVDVFDGPNRRDDAARRRAEIVGRTNRSRWWVHDEADNSMLYYGKYESPQTAAARRDLEAVKDLVERERVKSSAPWGPFLTPVEIALTGGAAGRDLRTAADRGMYTLQIGFYDGPERRDAAEQAVATLRDQGTEAYYFHGPNRSMVTVGVFPETAIQITSSGTEYAPQVEALQEQFPYNLANGRKLKETHRTGEVTHQPSFLVRIPGAP